MSRIRFLHAADLHLDSPFKGLREVSPDVAQTLYKATFDAYDNIIDLCLNERVDALLVAGDVFDSADRSLRAQIKFTEGLRRLDQAGIRSFVCHGNHDPLDGWEARIPLPPGCHQFGAEVEGVPVFPDEPDRAVVYGVSYPRREVRDSLVPRFPEIAPGAFSIGLMHANVGNNPAHDPYAPCSVADLEQTGIDYWALGHVHTREVLRESNPTVVYPGNPQGRAPNEPGARGVYLVEVDDAGRVDLAFHAVDLVRWESAQIDISDLDTEQALLDAIERTISDLRDESDGRSLVVRLRLVGSGAVHDSLARPGFRGDLADQVNQMWSARRPFVWCERIVDSTVAVFDREERLKSSDFVGDLLRLSDESMNDGGVLAESRERLQDLYTRGNARPYLQGHVPTDEQMRELMSAAEQAALAALLDESSQ
jgi:DNA repair exonuclease SbcCD nuclease subunit